MSPTSRRSILGSIAIGSVALAGCLSVGAATDSGSDPDGIEFEITTVNADCGSPDDEGASVDIDDDLITITGGVLASNPCHEAIIDAVELDDGLLTLTIGVESIDQDGPCVQCVGHIEFEATGTVDADAVVDDVIVEFTD